MFAVSALEISTCGVDGDRLVLADDVLDWRPDALLVVTPVFTRPDFDALPPAGSTFVTAYNDGSDFECPPGHWILRQLSTTSTSLVPGQKFNVLYSLPVL
jgi:hypothetical protein